MNIQRYFFWSSFAVIIILIIWGLAVSMSRDSALSSHRAPAPTTTNDHVQGPDNAIVTIVEYSDFQCPACQMYYFVVEKLLASSTVPIRFVYRQFPLAQHANAIPAALASEAAAVQGKFWEMHKLLFERHTEWETLSDPKPVFNSLATKIGLDLDKFKKDMNDENLKKKIDDSSKEGYKIGINATPSFFINGKFIENPKGYEEFKSIVEKTALDSTK